jgi:protein-S-isoprenylcysteine O-methyltransferase Ste14
MEIPFRIAVGLLTAAATAVALHFRLKAAAGGEKVSRKDEGLLLAIAVRTAGAALWLATFAWLVRPEWMRSTSFPLPDGVRWIGAGLGACGMAAMWWTLASLGKNLTDTVATRANATLVTHGPYRWVRHPFYVAAALLMLSVTLTAANWLIGLCGLAVIGLLAARTPIEERMLLARFGADYRNYMATTGRFVPRLRGPVRGGSLRSW